MEDGKKQAEPKQEHQVLERAERAFGPVIAGLILDFVDLATFGPAGLVLGGILGCAVGFWLCSLYRLNLILRIIGALAAGLYCMIPFTEVIPVATVVGAFVRFFEKSPEKTETEGTEGEE